MNISDEEMNKVILRTIDKIRYSHRNRPSFEKIYSYLSRSYNVEMEKFESQLQGLIEEGKVLQQTFNGKLSYRNVLTWKKPQPPSTKERKNILEMLSTNSSRRSSITSGHSEESGGSDGEDHVSSNRNINNNKDKNSHIVNNGIKKITVIKLRDDPEVKFEDVVESKRQRKKKVIYDPADYDVPVVRKKKKKAVEAASSSESVEEETEEDPRLRDLLGGFTRDIMFPENLNMCSECHRFMSGVKPDPMISCSSCYNECHRSCAAGKMISKKWYCHPCRRESQENKQS